MRSRSSEVSWLHSAAVALLEAGAGRRYFRPETMAAIDAVIEHEEVGAALLMAS